MVTLKDIARASGVSTATVSYVVNKGPKPVLPATRQRVEQVIADLGYVPNATARGLMGKRTHTFGVVFPHVIAAPMDNAYFAPVLTGIIDSATERRQIVMLFTGMSWSEAERSIPLFCDGRCDGFLFVAPPAGSELVARLIRRGIKAVLLGTRSLGLPVSTVDSDNVAGTKLATRHLIELGHRRIAMIQGDHKSTSSPERTLGYRLAMEEAGLPVDESKILAAAYEAEIAVQVAHRALAQPPESRPTAIVCAHDSIADAVLRAARELEIRIPEQLSVVGFDNLAFTSQTTPPLTTVEQSLRKIGSTAAATLLDMIDGRPSDPAERLFDVHLVVRSSTAPPSVL